MIRALPVIRTRYYTIYAYDEIAHVRVPPGYADHPEDERIFPSLTLMNDSSFGDLFGIADLARLQLPKCNNHLVSFIKVDGLSVPYIVDIFDTIKSRTMVYRSMDCRHFSFLTPLNQERWSIVLWSVHIFDIIKSRTMV